MTLSRATSRMAIVAALFGLSACKDAGPSGPRDSNGQEVVVSLQGAGATFPEPLYKKWFNEYNAEHPNVEVSYAGGGSGAGKKAFIDGTVDFAASDAAMTDEEMKKVARGVRLLPMTAGSVVLAYNLEGVKELKLSREAYLGIFTGKVTKWNDPLIADANKGVDLPNAKINVVSRSDSSGTTFVFTQHLKAISKDWADKPSTSHKWPVGVGAAGNAGVTANIKQTPGSIGYIEYGYAKDKLAMASLQNKAGEFVAPTLESGQKALAAAKLPADFIAWVPDPEPKDAYPIVTFTWVIAYQQYEDKAKLDAIKGILRYGLKDGQKLAAESGYIPLPESLVPDILKAVESLGS